MALRTAVSNLAYLKSKVNNRRRTSRFTTSTSPTMKAYAPVADHSPPSTGGIKSKLPKGDFIPVYVAVGMIALQVGFGAFTIWQLLGRAPNVSLKISRRETIPEVVEPESVADCGE